MQKSAIEETLDILELLKEEGIDITKIKSYKCKWENGNKRCIYLHEIQVKNIEAIIKKLRLNRNFPIGMRLYNLKRAYKGKNYYKITEESKRRIEGMGLIKKEEREEEINQILNILKELKEEGIDINNISRKKVVGNKKEYKCLFDIKADNIEQIMNKYQLNGDYPIGYQTNLLKRKYIYENETLDTEQRKQIEKLDLVSKLSKVESEQSELIDKSKKIENFIRELSAKLNKGKTIGDISE